MITIYCNKRYVNVVSLLKYLILLYSPLWWWCVKIKCLCNEMRWGKWCRHFDMVLGYYWPSDNMSEKNDLLPDSGSPRVTAITEGETVHKGGTAVFLSSSFNKILSNSQYQMVCENVVGYFWYYLLFCKIMEFTSLVSC